MRIFYNVNSTERRRLTEALGAIMLWEPIYARAPTFSYIVGNYSVDVNGTITCPLSATKEIVDQTIAKLKEYGFTPVAVEGDELNILLPKDRFTPEALDRLQEIVRSKAPLFKKAFRTENVPVEDLGDKICFPWFHLYGLEGETKAYEHFIAALAKFASERKRITAKPYTGDNDKFAMRLFLVQLGLKGSDYKQTRKILLMNLSGNSAWKNGAPPEPPRNVAVYARVASEAQISKPPRKENIR